LDDKTVDLIKDVGGDIKVALSELAKGLGIAAEHVYTVMVKQQIVYGILKTLPWVAFPILLLIFAIIFQKTVYKNVMAKAKEELYDDDDPRPIFVILILFIAWAATTLLFLMAPFKIANTLGYLINPEYYAIKDIVEFVKAMKK
jgi:phosphate/sulfate permease